VEGGNSVSKLFSPGHIGTLLVPNRLVRSATAERMSDPDGRPGPQFLRLYRDLARGGVGLIISGHMYVDPAGKAHPEMASVSSDDHVPALGQVADLVHREGGLVAVQINHGGMHANGETVDEPIAPSALDAPFLKRPAREMTPAEIELAIDSFAQAARRVKQAGFDGVQIHAAHGYLISQFLSPFVNRRTDEWGGDLEGRTQFLRAVARAVREQVGPAYPVFVKLGMLDGMEGGLTAEEGVQVVAALEEMGLDAVEISSGVGGGRNLSMPAGIRTAADEAYFRPLAQGARSATRLPIILVGGFRSRRVMEALLEAGDADFVSMARPLICEPDLPNRLRLGLQERACCISGNRCWAEEPGEGISCKCKVDWTPRGGPPE
jgi:2,4-dienoyl-CoA reductase-like NADH-dependent reductase (Old Yellow Enzyme family)